MRSLVRSRQAASPFNGLQAAMNDLFENFADVSAPAPWTHVHALESFSPRIDMTEDEKSVKVTAELPGIDEKDVDVSLSNGMLTIKGEKNAEREDKGDNWYRSERSYGAFMRTIPMPCDVDPEKVEAKARKGVLTVTLAKSTDARSKSRHIEIKA